MVKIAAENFWKSYLWAKTIKSYQFCYRILFIWIAVQENGETTDHFATRLRKLAANCEFQDVSKEIKSTIIQNGHSKRLRRYALHEEALSLDNLLAKARSLEASENKPLVWRKICPKCQVSC